MDHNESGKSEVESYLKRVSLFLEDEDWSNADHYCERVLDIDPENAQAYLGKLMAQVHAKTMADLQNCPRPFEANPNYQKIVRFGDEQLRSTLAGYINHIINRNNAATYDRAKNLMTLAATAAGYKQAALLFEQIPAYEDSATLAKECYNKMEKLQLDLEFQQEKNNAFLSRILKIAAIAAALCVAVAVIWFVSITTLQPLIQYNEATALMEAGQYDEAKATFEALGSYKNSSTMINEVEYRRATAQMEAGQYDEAREGFLALGDDWYAYRDSKEMIKEVNYRQAIAFAEEGSYVDAMRLFWSLEDYKDAGDRAVSLWDHVAVRKTISTCWTHTVALKNDGTVLAIGSNDRGECDVSGWTDIIAVSTGLSHTVGLKSDGTVVATGSNRDGQCNVSGWTDIVAIAAGGYHTLGLKSDGTVVATGNNDDKQLNVYAFQKVIAIGAGRHHSALLTIDGEVDVRGEYNRYSWSDISAIDVGGYGVSCLTKDGKVVGWSYEIKALTDTEYGSDVIAIAQGDTHAVWLKADGTVEAMGHTGYGACDVSDWTDIVAIDAGAITTIGLKADGTVVITQPPEYWDEGQLDVTGWTDIKLPEK